MILDLCAWAAAGARQQPFQEPRHLQTMTAPMLLRAAKSPRTFQGHKCYMPREVSWG